MAVYRLITIFLFIFFINVSSVSGASSLSPMDHVRTSVDTIIELLRNTELDKNTRTEKIDSTIREMFDFRVLSQRTLATNWKKATEDEKEKFVDLFSNLLVAIYMERLEVYTDERVVYVKEKIKKKRAVVETVIKTKSADIPIKYKMMQKGDMWLVYDVVIEEVSLLRNYRSSYREIVMKEGIDGLLARIEDKLKKKL